MENSELLQKDEITLIECLELGYELVGQSRYFQFPSSNITQKLFDHFLIMFILEHISYRVM